MGYHLNRRGLAVAACYGDDKLGKLYPAENIGADFKRNLTGKAAALADKPADKPEQLAD